VAAPGRCALKALVACFTSALRSARNKTRFAQLARISRSASAMTVRVLAGAGRHHQQRLTLLVALERLGHPADRVKQLAQRARGLRARHRLAVGGGIAGILDTGAGALSGRLELSSVILMCTPAKRVHARLDAQWRGPSPKKEGEHLRGDGTQCERQAPFGEKTA